MVNTSYQPSSPLSNLMLNQEQLVALRAELTPLVEAKLRFSPDTKDLVGSAVSMAYLDGKIFQLSAVIKAHEATMAKLSSSNQ